MSVTVVFASGGTGGHIIPALTTARYLKEVLPDSEIIFIGAGNELERRLMKDSEFSYIPVESPAIVGQGIVGIFKFIKGFWQRIINLRKIYQEKNVNLVLGFGGYPSVMPCLASVTMFLPTFIFEQNGQAGLANKFLSLFANKIFAVPGVRGLNLRNKITILNPVRKEIKKIEWSFSNKDEPLKILIVGGSQGAVSLNTAVLKNKDFFLNQNIKVFHQVGKTDYARMSESYGDTDKILITEYIQDMAESLRDADLVIGRAGATTVAEITALKKPAIFIPLAISNGHQKYNVLHLIQGGAAMMCDQNESLAETLKNKLTTIINNREILMDMHKSYSKIAELQGVEDGAAVLSSHIMESLRQ